MNDVRSCNASGSDPSLVPVALFAYPRPGHLRRTLACLRDNRVPLIYAFSDGPRTPDKAALVDQSRQILRVIDWHHRLDPPPGGPG